MDNLKDNLSDSYSEVVDEVQKVREEVSEMTIGEASEAAKEAVVAKVDRLGEAVESLGKQIEKAAPKRRFFRGTKRKK